MSFADDIVPVNETREDQSEKLDNWRKALKRMSFKFGHAKAKCLICNFDSKT